MKRRTLMVLVAVALTGLTAVVASPVASAKLRALSYTSTVGHSFIHGVGSGTLFSIKTCASASTATVPCQILNSHPPQDSIEIWCIAPTTAAGVLLTVSYIPSPALTPPPTLITIHCKAAHIKSVHTPSATLPVAPMKGASTSSALPYTVAACTASIVGTGCSIEGEHVRFACYESVFVNTLPVQVKFTITLQSAEPALNGKTMLMFIECI